MEGLPMEACKKAMRACCVPVGCTVAAVGAGSNWNIHSGMALERWPRSTGWPLCEMTTEVALKVASMP